MEIYLLFEVRTDYTDASSDRSLQFILYILAIHAQLAAGINPSTPSRALQPSRLTSLHIPTRSSPIPLVRLSHVCPPTRDPAAKVYFRDTYGGRETRAATRRRQTLDWVAERVSLRLRPDVYSLAHPINILSTTAIGALSQ